MKKEDPVKGASTFSFSRLNGIRRERARSLEEAPSPRSSVTSAIKARLEKKKPKAAPVEQVGAMNFSVNTLELLRQDGTDNITSTPGYVPSELPSCCAGERHSADNVNQLSAVNDFTLKELEGKRENQ